VPLGMPKHTELYRHTVPYRPNLGTLGEVGPTGRPNQRPKAGLGGDTARRGGGTAYELESKRTQSPMLQGDGTAPTGDGTVNNKWCRRWYHPCWR
ncbi:hypothetical protein BHM03_00057009, partial [Ensete ventricosum]